MSSKIEDIEAIIFDMDGVLVDSEELIKECETAVLEEEENITVSQEEIEAHEGMATKEYFQKMIQKKGNEDYTDKQLEERTKQMEEFKLELYFENMDQIDVISGAVETVKQLSEDFKVAVASNSEKRMVENVVDYLGINDYLDTFASFTDVENGKPEPEVFDYAANEMGVDPENTVVLEDSDAGTRAALNGGYNTFRYKREPIDGVIDDIDSMEQFRERMSELKN